MPKRAAILALVLTLTPALAGCEGRIHLEIKSSPAGAEAAGAEPTGDADR